MTGAGGPGGAGGSRGAALRPRYGRICGLGGAVVVTVVTMLAGTGILPVGEATVPTAAQSRAAPQTPGSRADAGAQAVSAGASVGAGEGGGAARPGPRQTPSTETDDAGSSPGAAPSVPPASGEGRRVVFDISEQRVWLVAPDGTVERTYLVSGSLTDNLDPGAYAVYSRSERAWGIDDSGTMEFMVRFARGERAAIGFHSIPVLDGEPVQTHADLGTPQSHGCIRQRRRDAVALWDFSPLGTTVVVTA